MARIVKNPIERRREIVKAARLLFQASGYESGSMNDIMRELGIAKGTIYHYFKSKDELLEAVVEDLAQEGLEKMQSIVSSNKSALEKMQALIASGRISEGNEKILQALHQKGNERLHSRLMAVTVLKVAPLYAIVIEQGCSEGVFSTTSPLECAEFILSGVQFLTDVGAYEWTPEDLRRRANALPRLIEQQLGAAHGSFAFLTGYIQ